MSRISLSLQFLCLLGLTTALLYTSDYSSPPAATDQQPELAATLDNPLLAQVSRSRSMPFTPQDLSQFIRTHDPARTSPGITVIPLSGPDTIWVITEDGTLINEWPLDAERARLLPSGNILVGFGSKFRDEEAPWKHMLNSLGEYSWNGDLRWEYTADDLIHHDHQRLPNGNTLFLRKTKLPEELLQKVTDRHRRATGQIADSIVEVTADGTTVWRWDAWESFDVNFCGIDDCTETIAEFTGYLDDPGASKKDKERALTKVSDWAHVNTVNVIPENQWFDRGDKRFRPGNLIVMPRKFKTVYIIDRETKQPVWEYSGNYKGGLGGAHEPYMIEKGFPGAGNIMIFDNGGLGVHPDESYVLEIQPVENKLVWVYDVGPQFNIRTRGGAQRLQNGNTLISEDPTGRVYEVTPEKEIVWEFHAPHPVNRAKRYLHDYCSTCTFPTS